MNLKEKIKRFAKKHYRSTVVILVITAATTVICTRQQKLFKSNKLTERAIKDLNHICNLCTKACITGEETTTTFCNDIFGKKVLIKFSEIKE